MKIRIKLSNIEVYTATNSKSMIKALKSRYLCVELTFRTIFCATKSNYDKLHTLRLDPNIFQDIVEGLIMI